MSDLRIARTWRYQCRQPTKCSLSAEICTQLKSQGDRFQTESILKMNNDCTIVLRYRLSFDFVHSNTSDKNENVCLHYELAIILSSNMYIL